MSEKTAIENILKQFVQDGHASEYFFATGSLTSPSPQLELATHPVVFDLSSLTKALVATPLIHALSLAGKLSIGGTLQQFGLPEELSHLRSIKISDILAHTSGLPAWRNFYASTHGQKNPTPILEKLSRVTVEPSLQGKDCYSDVGFILLGFLVVHHFKKSLNELFQIYVLDQIKFVRRDDFGYQTQLNPDLEFAPCGFCKLRNLEVCGHVQDENCWALGGETLHAGLFAGGQAVLEYLTTLARSPLGQHVFKANAKLLRTGNSGLAGWRQASDQINALFGDGRAMGHLGFTGCTFWLAYPSLRYVVLLTNRLIAGRDARAMRRLRREILPHADTLSCRDHR